ncbi:hypothetical protein MMC26_006934 [Xylographa opegraphella]|nr:hypothetical protein [Xylographa opegraphella]
MNHNALVDLTGSSDEERSSKRLRLHHDGRYSVMKVSNLIDLTVEEHADSLQPGDLVPPFSPSRQNVYRTPVLVDRYSEMKSLQSDAILSLSNKAPVYKDIGQVNGALMKLNGRPLAQMTVSRNSISDQRLEDIQTLQQPTINANLSSTPPKNTLSVLTALTDNEKSLALHTPIGEVPKAAENQASAPRIREDVSVSSPAAISYATPDAERESTEVEQLKELPLTFAAVQATLQNCLHELRGDHQYYIKSRLAHARQQHTSCTVFGINLTAVTATTSVQSRPTLNKENGFLQRTSPFRHLVALQRDKDGAHAGQQMTGRLCQLGAKATKQGPEITTAPCIAYSTGNVAIPPYTNYISTKRNILVEDDKNRTSLPYYGDDVPVDRDSADLESRITQNRSYYHHTNSIAEKAKLYGPYAESFLAKLGCDVSMVLRYLLDETSPAAPEELPPNLATVWLNREAHLNEGYYDDSEDFDSSVAQHRPKARRPQKQWTAVFNDLPGPSTSREAAAAGIACTAFANILDLSLWHVVKRHRLVLDAVTRKTRTADKDARISRAINSSPDGSLSPIRDSDPLGTYADLGCLVCYAHECPGHGEYEDNDDQKNVRVRINAKPPSPKLPKDKPDRHITKEEMTKVVSSLSAAAIGINEDRSITGKPWAWFNNEESGFKDDEMCSDKCFWLKSNRFISSSSWNDDDLKLFNTLIPAHQANRRGCCLLALSMNKPCNEVCIWPFIENVNANVDGGFSPGPSCRSNDFILGTKKRRERCSSKQSPANPQTF